MSNVKVIAKGEYLFKEGDKVQNLVLIQSGAIQLCYIRPKKNIDLALLGAGQVVGEQALLGTTYPYSALATIECKILEVPAEMYKQQVESSSQMLKVTLKSLSERLKVATQEIRTLRLEKDSSPCPEDQVAKVFGSIYHSARYKGTKDAKNPQLVKIDWPVLRQYSQRIFGESLKRLEQATQILVKMKMASYIMGKLPEDPEGPDQILEVQFSDLETVEAFFEHFQYYYFKGGKTDILKSEDSITQLLQQFVKIGEKLEKDRFGAVTIEYSKVIEHFKTEMSINLNNDHFSRLESKGVFVKRQPKQDGSVWISYDIKEFQSIAKIWKILREVEKWNEKGFVDMSEDDSKPKKKPGEPSCPSCAVAVAPQAKFCHECGHKLSGGEKAAA